MYPEIDRPRSPHPHPNLVHLLNSLLVLNKILYNLSQHFSYCPHQVKTLGFVLTLCCLLHICFAACCYSLDNTVHEIF